MLQRGISKQLAFFAHRIAGGNRNMLFAHHHPPLSVSMMQVQRRNFLILYDEYDFLDSDDDRMEVLNVDQYAEIEDIVESIGADPFPGFKKERLKRKERRLMIENKKVARKANIQVNSVLDIIELKRHLGMRLK